jgi:hypothetical protein
MLKKVKKSRRSAQHNRAIQQLEISIASTSGIHIDTSIQQQSTIIHQKGAQPPASSADDTIDDDEEADAFL